MSSDEEIIDSTPPDLRAEAELAIQNLLPPKSMARYMVTYANFIQWKTKKNAHSFSEHVFLAYFKELSETRMSSTLWVLYSMLKATMQVKHNINIKRYANLTMWLKRQGEGYKAKKSNIFSPENVQAFLNQAPDEIYLATKVALILGISGACRGVELTNITLSDVEFQGDIAIVKLRDTKTKIDRSFVIRDEFLDIFKKYCALRPENTQSDRLFLNYTQGKCTRQVIGRHKMLSLPKQIAQFLNLEHPELYTGHCFRRTSATFLADSGASLRVLKTHGGWKSDKVVEGYIEDSVKNKEKITKSITKDIVLNNKNSAAHQPSFYTNPQPSTSRDPPVFLEQPSLYTNPQPGTSRDPPVFLEPASLYTNPQPGTSRDPPVFLEPASLYTNPQPGTSRDFPVFSEVPSAPCQPPLHSHQSQISLGESQPQPQVPPQVTSSGQSSTRIVSSQPGSSAEIQQTTITVPGKTITISISNCPNMSNVSFNIS